MSRRTVVRRGLLGGAGGLLLLAALGLAATTERTQLLRVLAAQRHGGPLIEGGDGPRAGMHGSLLRVAGTPVVVEQPQDPEFNLSAPTPLLTRRVEMFQWRELKMGGELFYEMDWSPRYQDSSRFAHPRGHRNPAKFPLEGARFEAGLVRLDHYVLGSALIRALPGAEPVPPDPARLPANLAASFSPYQGYLVTSQDPAHPRLGDVRVSWQAVPVQAVTVFARLDGNRLDLPPPARGDAGGALGAADDVQLGDRSLSDLLPDVPQPQRFVALRRAGAVLLAALGAFLLLWERRRRKRDVLMALAVGLTAVSAVSCAVWLGGETAPMLGWLGLTALGAVAVGLVYRFAPVEPRRR